MKYVGARVPSLIHRQLVAGRGQYVADIHLDGMLHAAVSRSPYAHARIVRIDTTAARREPGVVDVVTGDELREKTRPIPQAFDPQSMGAKAVDCYALATDRVRYAGEAVAAVIAEDKRAARRAADRIEVEYEELPVIVDPVRAMAAGAPLLVPSWGDNVLLAQQFTAGDIDAAFREADGRLSGELRTQRYTAAPLEPRGYVAACDPFTGELTFWASTQCPHPLRVFLAGTLGLPETAIRVIQPRVGGAFGQKIPMFQEEPLVAYLAVKHGRAVKWIEERGENLLAGGHAREMLLGYEVAHAADGRILGLRVRVVADVGAPSALCGWAMSYVTAYCIPTVYKIPNCHVDLFSVVTNKCPWNAYRGFGKETASFLMDRIVDHVAAACGRDRTEVRLRNFIQPGEFPYSQPSGAVLDSGDYPKALRRVLEMIDYEAFPKLQAEARRQGRRVGIGIGQELTPEGCSVPSSILVSGYDAATLRVDPSGTVTVLTGVTSPGTGNETAMAQIAADALGIDIADVRVVQGDTAICPFGLGNYSSRSVIIGGSAVHVAATEIREKMARVAAKHLEAAPQDIDVRDGRFFLRGAPSRFVSFRKVADLVYRHAYEDARDVEPGLEVTRYFRHPNVYHQPEVDGRFSSYPSWPNQTVACIVEVDPDTGVVKILRYCGVHDSGVVVNPLMAEGNLHGGTVQGIGGALFEQLVYDEIGQLVTGTFLDYTLPTAVDVPRLEIEHQETPSPFTPLGTKGVGESGVTGPLGALCGAVENAFPELKLRFTAMPLTPQRVWRA
ncbi:MAG: xanthine dehydrogenase family protein, partial [Deltaproteobacteria bacterium]|nr:xanthine dehydrogenase family protein [Deltaproteobacteria bacterium]